MASIIIGSGGVSTIYLTPSPEVSSSYRNIKRTPTCCFSSNKSHHNALLAGTSLRKQGFGLVGFAIATPNSVLSEEAFKGIGGLSNKGDSEEDYGGSGDESVSGAVSEDELAIPNLGLPQTLLDALLKRGITHLFPIQRAVLIPALEGRDIIARAKTGTGKTLAFGIPIIKRLTEDAEETKSLRRSGRLPRVLVLAPTRELAKQVEKELKESAPQLNTVCVYGGVSYTTQQNALSRGVDVVVGTPGRIIDLIKSNSLRLGEVEYLVLDEADQMLAVGFEEDVEVILENLPSKRQSMLFSATMPVWVKKLARKYLDHPLQIDLVGDEDEKLAEGIKLYAIPSTSTSKGTILGDLITVYAKGGKTIVFTRTKRDADEVSLALTSSVTSEALHGDISQHQRERTLNGFRQGKFGVLVATDVAARGLDIPNVDLIIHYEIPNDSETFVHRSGRTGRAGKEGIAILMFTSSQRRTVRSIERETGCKFEFISPPAVEEVLESSAQQVVSTLSGVHPESIEFFTPTAQKLLEEQGTTALAAALAQLSGFCRPPSGRSLINHEQGWVTLQLKREQTYSRGFLSVRSVTGFLSDVYPAAADEVGKIYLIADEMVQGAVFDLPEEIAKELLSKQLPPGNSLSKITKLPALQDDGPPSDYFGKFSSRERFPRGGPRNQRGSRNSHAWGSGRDSDNDRDSYRRGGRSNRTGNNWSRMSRSSDDDWLIGGRNSGGSSPQDRDNDRDSYRRGGRSNRTENNWSRMSRSSDDDWLIGGRKSGGSSPQDRRFGGSCFKCGRTGHRASECTQSDF